MRRLLLLLLHLYPRRWRERYGREFRCLIDDLSITCSDVFDIAASAIGERMRELTSRPVWQGVVAFVLFGGLAGMVVSELRPKVYVSRARVQFDGTSPEGLSRLTESALARRPLQHVIRTRHLFDSTSVTEEDKVDWMRSQITVALQRPQDTLSVAFTHSDRATAKQVTTDLIGLLQAAGRSQSLDLKIIDPAFVSPEPVRPAATRTISAGLASGLLIGMAVAAFSMMRTRRGPPVQPA